MYTIIYLYGYEHCKNVIILIKYLYCIVYHGRSDKGRYRHDRRANKNPYRHDRHADRLSRNR